MKISKQPIICSALPYEIQSHQTRGYPHAFTFGIPGGQHSFRLAPNDAGEEQRRVKVRSLLQTNSTIPSLGMSRSSGLCSHHEPGNLKSIFSAPRQGRIYDLGYIDDILSERSCQFCQFIQSWIYKNKALFEKQSSPIKCELCPQGSRFNEENDFGSSSEEAHHYDNFRLQATRVGYSSDGALPLIMSSSFEAVSFWIRLTWPWLRAG